MHNQDLSGKECCTTSCTTSCTTGCSKCCSSCVSWSGIIVGALVAIGLTFLLNLFALAIGLSAFTTSADGVVSMAVGGYIGMLIGVVAVFSFSGWVAGYLTRVHTGCHQFLGALSGFLAWSLSLIIMVVIAAHTTSFVSNNFQTLSNRNATVAGVINNSPVQKVAQAQGMATKGATVNSANQVVATKDAVENLGISLLLTFALFFIGALASAMGGVCGVKSKECKESKDKSCCN